MREPHCVRKRHTRNTRSYRSANGVRSSRLPMMNRPIRNIPHLFVVVLALLLGGVAAVASRGAGNADGLPQAADSESHGRQGYHPCAVRGISFSWSYRARRRVGRRRGGRTRRNHTGYSAYLAAIFRSVPEFTTLTWQCIRDASCTAGSRLRRRARLVTAVVRGVTVSAAVLAAFLFTGGVTPSALAGLACLLLLQRDTPTLLAGLLLLGHAALAARTWSQPRLLTGLASGVALGLLVLTSAIYQYSLMGVPLIWLAGVWLHPERRRSAAPAFAALAVAAWAVTLPWMVRQRGLTMARSAFLAGAARCSPIARSTA